MANENNQPTKRCPSCQKDIPMGAKKCPYCQSDLRTWFRRHPILTVLGGLVLFFIVIISVGGSSEEGEREATTPKAETETISETAPETPKQEVVEDTAEKEDVEEGTKTEPTPEPKTDRNAIIEILKSEALAEWGDDYEMVQYELNNQIEAYDWVASQSKYPNIMDRAKAEWGNDYEMVKYEYENQVEAYEGL